jgi:hypothetical protein
MAAVGVAFASNCGSMPSFYRREVIIVGLWGVCAFVATFDVPWPRWLSPPFSASRSSSSSPPSPSSKRIQLVCFVFSLLSYSCAALQRAAEEAPEDTSAVGWLPLKRPFTCEFCACGYLMLLCVDTTVWSLLNVGFLKVAVQVGLSFGTFVSLFSGVPGFGWDPVDGGILTGTGIPLVGVAAVLHVGIVVQRFRRLWTQRVQRETAEAVSTQNVSISRNLTAWADGPAAQ